MTSLLRSLSSIGRSTHEPTPATALTGHLNTRRFFLQALIPLLTAARSPATVAMTFQQPLERGQFSDEDLGWVRQELLKLVNSNRADAKLAPLELDDLACRVANEHATDMVQGDFLSHWGRNGLKPYQRYALAGGIDAVQENVSAAHNIPSVSPLRVLDDLKDMHAKMLAEKPPNDGHRRAILTEQHTHVGFGIALKGHNLRLTELFLNRYLELKPFAQTAKPKSSINIAGKLLSPTYALHEVDVFFESLPSAPSQEWLQTPKAYSLPEDYVALRPKTPYPTTYTDGSTGNYEWDRSGKFKVPVKFPREQPGIYTILFWIKRNPDEKKFPAAQVCVRCE